MSKKQTAETSETNQHASLVELNETVDRLMGHDGVESVQIFDKSSVIVGEPQETKLIQKILQATQEYTESMDDGADISFIQIRQKSGRELYVAPHQGYVLAVRKSG